MAKKKVIKGWSAERRAKWDAAHPKAINQLKKALKGGIFNAVDLINYPPHYTSGKIEVLDFIEDQQLGYHLGSVVKYVARAGKKNPLTKLEDLKKAQFYLNRKISNMEKEVTL